MNRVILTGRLTRDPELRSTQDGQSVCTFSLAVRRYGKSDKADFINCTAWGKTAENCNQFLRKGDRAAVLGAIHTDTYEKDGQKRTAFNVSANEVEFLEQKSASGGHADMTPVDTDDFLPF